MQLPTFYKDGRETKLLISNHFYHRMLERLFSAKKGYPKTENMAVMIAKWLMKCQLVERPGREGSLYLICEDKDFVAVMSMEGRPALVTCYSYKKSMWASQLPIDDSRPLFTEKFGFPNRDEMLYPDVKREAKKRYDAKAAEYAAWAESMRSTPEI